MRRPCCQTSEDTGTDTMRWKWQEMSERHRWVSRLFRRTTRVITLLPHEFPRPSSQNWEVTKKSSAVPKIYLRWQSFEKANHPGGVTSPPVPTVGPSNRIWTSIHPYHATSSLLELRGDGKNRPRRKIHQDDGALRPRGTPVPIDIKNEKGEIIRARRGADNCWCHDGVKRDHPSGIYGDV